MRIVVAGASGSIGTALVPRLRAAGHDVVRLVRREARDGDEVRWDPAAGSLDPAQLTGVDAAINLSGPGIAAKRWTPSYKAEVKDSRVAATRTLSTALAALDTPPRVLLSASAVGFYGDTGDAVVDESAPPGSDFLAETCVEWEAATRPAEGAGIRVAHLRTGVVMSRRGGLLYVPVPLFGMVRVRLLTLYRLGLGGPLGNGRQWMSWVTMTDEVRAIEHLLEADVSGPVNLTAPEPVTNATWTKALGAALHRPTRLPVPRFALRMAVGEFADVGALVSQRVLPRRLTESGFTFAHRSVARALRAELATGSPRRS